MENRFCIKAEIFKIFKSKGYLLAIPLFILPLFSFVGVMAGVEGLVSPNSSIVEWNLITLFTNKTFNITQIVYFIYIYRYYISEINSGYFKNISLVNGDVKNKVKGKNRGIASFLLIIYFCQILFSTLLYMLLFFSKKVVFSGKIFSPTYNIYALSFIVMQGIIFCSAYPRLIISTTLLIKRQSSILILLFIMFMERGLENSKIISYILPWNIILKYFLKLGNDHIFNVALNSIIMILYGITYVVILEIINRIIVRSKKIL